MRLEAKSMRSLASLLCGYVFGWGLFISGMIRPEKVLGFLDVLAIPSGNWDPSLAIVVAAALVVTAAGYALARRRVPIFEQQNQWPAPRCSVLAGAWSACARDPPSRIWRRCRLALWSLSWPWSSARLRTIGGTPAAPLQKPPASPTHLRPTVS